MGPSPDSWSTERAGEALLSIFSLAYVKDQLALQFPHHSSQAFLEHMLSTTKTNTYKLLICAPVDLSGHQENTLFLCQVTTKCDRGKMCRQLDKGSIPGCRGLPGQRSPGVRDSLCQHVAVGTCCREARSQHVWRVAQSLLSQKCARSA